MSRAPAPRPSQPIGATVDLDYAAQRRAEMTARVEADVDRARSAFHDAVDSARAAGRSLHEGRVSRDAVRLAWRDATDAAGRLIHAERRLEQRRQATGDAPVVDPTAAADDLSDLERDALAYQRHLRDLRRRMFVIGDFVDEVDGEVIVYVLARITDLAHDYVARLLINVDVGGERPVVVAPRAIDGDRPYMPPTYHVRRTL